MRIPLLYFFLFLFLTGLVSLPAQAQRTLTNPDLLPTSFLPTSPTVAGLQLVDARSHVDLTTGAAQFSIPLATLTSGPLQLSASLAYSYSGLKTYQPKDLVGLGWSLQAGGSITRQVNGLKDEFVGSYGKYDPQVVRSRINNQEFLHNVSEGWTDAQPDVYSFTVPGYTGQFIIQDTAIILLPQQPLRIARLDQHNFQLLTEAGTRYFFESREDTQPDPHNFGTTLGDFTSAWHLTRIISAGNTDTIRLHYSNPGNGSYQEPSRCAQTSFLFPLQVAGACAPPNSTPRNTYTRGSIIRPQYLDSITTRDTRLLIDRNQEHVVQRVRLVSARQRRSLRRFELLQTFFEGEGGGTSNRLRLDQVRESNAGQQLPAYRFQYNTSVRMPAWQTLAQDYWGYYNGATGNRFLLTNPRLLSDAANRLANFAFSVGGALEQVTYPTGGYTRFSYEQNRYQTQRRFSYRELEVDVRYEEGRSITLPRSDNNNAAVQICAAQAEFTLPYRDSLIFHISRYKSEDEAAGYVSGATNRYRDLELYRRYQGRDSLLATRRVLADVVPENTHATQQWGITLSPGHYTVRVISEKQGTVEEQQNSILVRIPEVIVRDAPGGGIRVRQIVSTALGTVPHMRTYAYTNTDQDGTYSSGRVLTRMTEDHTNRYTEADFFLNNCQFENITSDNSIFGTELYKVPFFYECVTESETEGSVAQGVSVSYFQSTNDLLGGNSLTNTVELQEKRIYRYTAAQQLQLAQQDRYTYFIDAFRSCTMLRTQPDFSTAGSRDTLITQQRYTPLHTTLFASFTAPSVVRQVRYDARGDSSVAVTLSTYRNQRLIREASRTSTAWQVTKFKYLSDYAPSLPPVAALRRQHFNPLIESQRWQRALNGTDSTLTAGTITLYDPTWRAPASTWHLRLPTPTCRLLNETLQDGYYTALLSDPAYQLEATAEYDAVSGRLSQHQRAQDIATSYVWGYGNMLPIAEAKNATVAQVQAELRATGISWQAPASDQQLRQALAQVRQRLPKARIISYTHLPGVGLSSQTGPDGRTIFYEYDALGRLLRVRDEQNRILTEQEYKYAPQP